MAWSPDGRWLAFSELDMTGGAFRDADWTVYIARADGTQKKRIASHAMYVSWLKIQRQQLQLLLRVVRRLVE